MRNRLASLSASSQELATLPTSTPRATSRSPSGSKHSSATDQISSAPARPLPSGSPAQPFPCKQPVPHRSSPSPKPCTPSALAAAPWPSPVESRFPGPTPRATALAKVLSTPSKATAAPSTRVPMAPYSPRAPGSSCSSHSIRHWQMATPSTPSSKASRPTTTAAAKPPTPLQASKARVK